MDKFNVMIIQIYTSDTKKEMNVWNIEQNEQIITIKRRRKRDLI
jgi:hypothetical protein